MLAEMLNYHILLLNLNEWDGTSSVRDCMVKMSREHPRLFVFLSRHVKDVEIVRKTGEHASSVQIVERVFFPVDPSVMQLTLTRDFRHKTSQFMFDVPRSNPHEKARAFMKKMLSIARSVQWMTHNLRSPVRAFIIRRRDVMDVIPLALAIIITLCLLLFYGIPVDPNTRTVLAGGKFYSVDSPAGYSDTPYAFSDLTSDPQGAGASLGTLSAASDMSLTFRVRLMTRWESSAEWEMWPEGRTLLIVLASLHALMTLVNATVYLTQDLPLVIFETTDRQRRRQQQTPPSSRADAWQEGEEDEVEVQELMSDGGRQDDKQPHR